MISSRIKPLDPTQGREDDSSVCEVLALQAGGPEFDTGKLQARERLSQKKVENLRGITLSPSVSVYMCVCVRVHI